MKTRTKFAIGAAVVAGITMVSALAFFAAPLLVGAGVVIGAVVAIKYGAGLLGLAALAGTFKLISAATREKKYADEIDKNQIRRNLGAELTKKVDGEEESLGEKWEKAAKVLTEKELEKMIKADLENRKKQKAPEIKQYAIDMRNYVAKKEENNYSRYDYYYAEYQKKLDKWERTGKKGKRPQEPQKPVDPVLPKRPDMYNVNVSAIAKLLAKNPGDIAAIHAEQKEIDAYRANHAGMSTGGPGPGEAEATPSSGQTRHAGSAPEQTMADQVTPAVSNPTGSRNRRVRFADGTAPGDSVLPQPSAGQATPAASNSTGDGEQRRVSNSPSLSDPSDPGHDRSMGAHAGGGLQRRDGHLHHGPQSIGDLGGGSSAPSPHQHGVSMNTAQVTAGQSLLGSSPSQISPQQFRQIIHHLNQGLSGSEKFKPVTNQSGKVAYESKFEVETPRGKQESVITTEPEKMTLKGINKQSAQRFIESYLQQNSSSRNDEGVPLDKNGVPLDIVITCANPAKAAMIEAAAREANIAHISVKQPSATAASAPATPATSGGPGSSPSASANEDRDYEQGASHGLN